MTKFMNTALPLSKHVVFGGVGGGGAEEGGIRKITTCKGVEAFKVWLYKQKFVIWF